GTADRNRSHWSTSKTPSYTKSVSWQHHPHNKPIVHPKVTTFTHLSQLPELWKARGWDITA
ncbi:hypothetical protein SNA57_12365, partial [Escherichia coli]|nr:hypothetical protein [Escherichia coli]